MFYSKHFFQNEERRTFIDDKRYELQSNEANYIHLNARMRLEASCSSLVNTVPHGGQLESVDWKAGLALGMEFSVVCVSVLIRTVEKLKLKSLSVTHTVRQK